MCWWLEENNLDSVLKWQYKPASIQFTILTQINETQRYSLCRLKPNKPKAIFKSWPLIMSLCFLSLLQGESHTIHLAAQVSKLSESRSRPQLTVWPCSARWRHGGKKKRKSSLLSVREVFKDSCFDFSPLTKLLFLMDFGKILCPLVHYLILVAFALLFQWKWDRETHEVVSAPGIVTLPCSCAKCSPHLRAIVSTTCVALRSRYTAAEDSCFQFNAVSKQDPLGPK